jgi:anti-anti-sigma factor
VLAVEVVSESDHAVRLRVAGELDMQTGPRLQSAVEDVRAAGRTVTVDVSALTFIDCAGLRLLLELRDVDFEGELSAPVARVLDLTQQRAALPWHHR